MDTENIRKESRNLHGIITLTLFMVMIALGAYTYLTVNEAKYAGGGQASISVSGDGEAIAVPDIATFSFSVVAEGDDAATAQDKSAESINAIVEYLKGEGVEERDIKTQYYNLYPRYDYVQAACDTTGFCPPGERVLRGYEVNQTVQVKVRDVDTAGSLVSGVGTRGATNVSSLQFTIDDEEVFLAEAREKAITDAKEKAARLADDLDVKLVRVVQFWEEGNYGRGYGLGGAETMAMDAAMEEKAVTPNVPIGENTFTSRVNITYEIK